MLKKLGGLANYWHVKDGEIRKCRMYQISLVDVRTLQGLFGIANLKILWVYIISHKRANEVTL